MATEHPFDVNIAVRGKAMPTNAEIMKHMERRDEWRALAAFVCMVFGSTALIASTVVLWFDPEVITRRLAIFISLGYLVLVPWAFLAWQDRHHRRQTRAEFQRLLEEHRS